MAYRVAVTEADRAVDVLAVRKRPPYDYGDLEELLQKMPNSGEPGREPQASRAVQLMPARQEQRDLSKTGLFT
jgi:hypothetical protein